MPSIRAEQLASHLSRQLAPLYLIHGDEPLIALEAADAIRERARRSGFTERSVLTVERGFRWGELGAAGASMSLFGDRKLIELRIPGGKPGTDGGEAIQAWCRRIPEDVVLLVNLPRLPRRDQASAWFSAFAQSAVVVEVWPVERARLPEWISARLARQKQRAGRQLLQFLADSVEGNLLAAHQEIQKLALLFPEGELEFTAVRAAVLNVARYDAGQLGEAMLAADPPRFVRMLDGLRSEGEAAPRILWVLAEELRALARVKEGLSAGRPPAELYRENRVFGEPRQALMGRAAQRTDLRRLRRSLSDAARIDRIAKGVARGDPWDEMLQLGLAFARV
jgi:DNA polymerase-3 subunit delta